MNDIVKILLKYSGDSFDADYEANDDKRERALNVATQAIEDMIEETYKKAYIQGGIDAYNARYNALMDTDGVDDRRDDSAKSEVTID